MRSWHRWIPGALLLAGFVLNSTLVARRAGATQLVGSLETVADTVLGVTGRSIIVGEDEARVAGFTDYTMREYTPPDEPLFTIYVGYYDEQRQGKSIHSPKNCLPGAGWDPVGQGVVQVDTPLGEVGVNRFELVNEQARAIVYYWYQGRDRVAHNEYRVKLDLLRDAAIHGRTEEALVRIVVPVIDDDIAAADAVAMKVAPDLVADVARVLPKL